VPYVDGVFVQTEWLDKSIPQRIDPTRFEELGIVGKPTEDYGKNNLPYIVPAGVRDEIRNVPMLAGKKWTNRSAKCRRCGKGYEQKGGHHFYCSEDCKRRDRFGERTCPVCKKTFGPKTATTTFCSRKCYTESGVPRRWK